MNYEIQPNFFCENCIKCGARPVVEQNKKGWEIKCPNKACKNSVTNRLVDFASWNRLNKKNVNITADQRPLKRTA